MIEKRRKRKEKRKKKKEERRKKKEESGKIMRFLLRRNDNMDFLVAKFKLCGGLWSRIYDIELTSPLKNCIPPNKIAPQKIYPI